MSALYSALVDLAAARKERNAAVSTTSYTTTLELVINGHACVRDALIEYEYRGPEGDGWDEPSYGASATVYTVSVDGVNLTPILSDAFLKGLAADCLEHEEAEREYAREQAAEWKREETV